MPTPATEDPTTTAESLLEEAENQGLLVPLETAATKMGKTPKELLDAAQSVPALAGKTPENLAQLLTDKKNRDLLMEAMGGSKPPEEGKGMEEDKTVPKGGPVLFDGKAGEWKDAPRSKKTNLFPMNKNGGK